MNEALRDEHIKVVLSLDSLQEERIQALFQLMNIGDSKSVDAIVKCLREDPCEIVRHEAAFVLGEVAAFDSVDELKRAIDCDISVIVKHEALLALGTISDSSVIDFLKSKLDDRVKLISESAKIALQRIEKIDEPYRGPKHFDYLNE